jgi:tetratricopeptide (TPR) repeat protein
MADIFVNYRSVDVPTGAAACYELLSRRFGTGRVFRDCDSILPGEPYPAAIRQQLDEARVLLVFVGPHWLAPDPGAAAGTRLVDRPGDWVRREIRHAFTRDIVVVPVLFDGVAPPTAAELPGDIARLANCQAVRVDHRTFGADAARLADRIAARVPELLLPGLFEEVPSLPDGALPSMLLRAQYGVVPFERRAGELARLTAWLDAPGRISARLLAGPGGQGKTRLADKLIREACAGGWAAGFLPEHLPGEVLARVHEFGTPLLLVVDYAEGRTQQLTDLAVALASRPAERGPVRLLMLARSTGMWQHLLRRSRDDRVALIFTDVPVEPLAPLLPTATDHRSEFDRALRAFAARLGRSTTLISRPANLDSVRYDRALDVHAAALAALLDQALVDQALLDQVPLGQPAAEPMPARGDPVLRVLDHERRHWAGTTALYALPDPHDARLGQVVSAATLFGAKDAAGAQALLTALPTLDGMGHDAADRYRRWLAALYPGAAALNPLRPDRLGEDLVATTLRECPGLGAAVAPVIDETQLTQALTVLARAAPRHPHVQQTMTALLTRDALHRIPLAIAVATRVEDESLIKVLSEVLDAGQGGDLDLDKAVVEHLPSQSLALAAFAVVRTRAALNRQLAQAQPEDAVVAWLTHNLSLRLEAVSSYDEALVTASRAVELYEALLAADDDYAMDLAGALNTLAGAYDDLGLYEDGLDPAVRSVSLLRRLVPPSPDSRHMLATSLMTYAVLLRGTGRHCEAVAIAEEATAIHRAEYREAPDDEHVDRLFRLAASLDSLASALSGAGREQDALAAVEEAAGAYRALDSADSDQYRSDLITALGNLCGAYSALGQLEDGRGVAEEAVLLSRELVGRHGDAHLRGLADVLTNSATVLRRLGRYEDAITQVDEAVLIYRKLAVDQPGTELASLAAALHNLGIYLTEAGQAGSARDVFDESIDIYRKLSDPRPESFEPELAEVIGALAGLMQRQGDYDQALDLAAESAAILKRMFDTGRAELRGKYAHALHRLAHIRLDLCQYGEAARIAAQAAELYAALVAAGRPDMRVNQASNLHCRARASDMAGQHAGAADTFAVATGLLRELTGEDDTHAGELAAVLQDFAVCLSALGRDGEALKLVSEAVDIRRERLDDQPDTLMELAGALNNLADTLHDLGMRDEAIPVAAEAVESCSRAYDDGHQEAAALYVYALVTETQIRGAADVTGAVAALVRAWQVAGASGDGELAEVVVSAFGELAAERPDEVRGAWSELAGTPCPGSLRGS